MFRFLIDADVCGRIDEMAEYINDHLKTQENARKLLEIQKGLTGQTVPGLMTPGRRFVREGRLMKVCVCVCVCVCVRACVCVCACVCVFVHV